MSAHLVPPGMTEEVSRICKMDVLSWCLGEAPDPFTAVTTTNTPASEALATSLSRAPLVRKCAVVAPKNMGGRAAADSDLRCVSR